MKIDPPTWHPAPSKPGFVPPPGAVDAHCHVFGPGSVFPYAPARKYTPSDAPKETLFALRRHLGLSRSVIVQASCHGRDNRAMLDALAAEPGTCRGVAVVDPDISDAELGAMHQAGVRGVRFNFVRRLVEPDPLDLSTRLAARVTQLGWHVVVYLEPADLPDLEGFLTGLPCPVVIDHMGRPDLAEGLNGPGFTRLLRLMGHDRIWMKVGCPERLSLQGPPYDDVVPYARVMIEGFEDRVLWGTDWPHPNVGSPPDDGLLVDCIPHIAPTERLRRKLLLDNPERLYFV